MKRKMEIINGIRVSKCGAKHMKPFPAVVMQKQEPVAETVKKKEYKKPEPPTPPNGKIIREGSYPRKPNETEPESLFDFRKGRRGNAAMTEDEQ